MSPAAPFPMNTGYIGWDHYSDPSLPRVSSGLSRAASTRLPIRVKTLMTSRPVHTNLKRTLQDPWSVQRPSSTGPCPVMEHRELPRRVLATFSLPPESPLEERIPTPTMVTPLAQRLLIIEPPLTLKTPHLAFWPRNPTIPLVHRYDKHQSF